MPPTSDKSLPNKVLRFWAWVAAIAALQFAAVLPVAAAAYWGPSAFCDEAGPYRFWSTMLCALGEVNSELSPWRQAIAVIFDISMGGLALGLLAMFMMLPQCFSTLRFARPVGWVVRIGGVISVLAMVGVAAVPSSPHWLLHGIFIGLAAFPGVGAFLIAVIAICIAHQVRRSVQFALVIYATLCVVHLGQYVVRFIFSHPDTYLFPVLQKVLTVMTLVLLLGIANASLKKTSKK